LTFVALSPGDGKRAGSPRYNTTTAKVPRIIPVTPVEQHRYDNAETRRQVRLVEIFFNYLIHLLHNYSDVF